MGIWLDRAMAAREVQNNIPPVPEPTLPPKPTKNEKSGGFVSFDGFGIGATLSEPHLVDFAERVAILIESGGHSPDDAHRLAIDEIGGNKLDLWRYHIERLPTATTMEATQLLRAATTFLKSPVAAMAAYHGWDDLAVFGIFNGPPRAMLRRHDAMGLVPALAWSRIGSKLVDIDGERAIIETYTGNTLTHKRPLTGRCYAVPVWWFGILQETGVDNERS